MNESRQYEVIAVLGQGGFGTVYHARFLGEGGFSKEVALKVLNPEMEGVTEFASRLRDEARVLGLVRHRAIVGVDRLTMLDGRWTVVMEYIEGHDLGHLLSRGPLPAGVALEITAEIAGALHAAYTRNSPHGQPLRLLHRDLKPSNVRVTPFGEVKVLDFGIARAEFVAREAKTRSLAFGTPEYMSPERLDAAGDSAAGDVYSLGAVLYELVAGVQLGRTSANPEKHAKRLSAAMAGLREVEVPGPVCDLIHQMLSFEESHRPSAGDVERRASALARHLGDVPLRTWVDELADVHAHQAPETGAATGSILIETPAARSAPDGTVWQRTPISREDVGRSNRTPERLEPAATEAVPVSHVAPVQQKHPIYSEPTRETAPPQHKPPPSTLRRFAVPALVALGVLTVGLVILARPSGPQPPPPGESTAPVDATTAITSNPPSAPAEEKPPPGLGDELLDSPPPVSRAPQSNANTRTPAPTPSIRSAPGTQMAAVRLTGDAARASLRTATLHYPLPATVPYGTYSIQASFDDAPEVNMGSLTVDGRQQLTVQCDSQFGKCAVSKDPP